MPEASLSVVIAAWPDTAGLQECLDSIFPQRRPDTEIIVVSPCTSSPGLPFDLEWLQAPPDKLIPHLWSLGMARARGDIVAITTAHFSVAPDWLAVIAAAHAGQDAAAVGGPIDPPRSRGLVSWATYFLRYSAYFRYAREQEVDDLAGDNAAYRRTDLLAHPEFLRDGFWEIEYHKRLRRQGRAIVFVPAMRAALQRGFGFLPFLGHRFRHGREFGQARLRGRGAALRAAAVLASPLIPFLLLAKIVTRVLKSGRDRAPFLACLPILVSFIVAWALGEAAGYLAPAPAPTDRRVGEGLA